jgi:hypothetical protein
LYGIGGQKKCISGSEGLTTPFISLFKFSLLVFVSFEHENNTSALIQHNKSFVIINKILHEKSVPILKKIKIF